MLNWLQQRLVQHRRHGSLDTGGVKVRSQGALPDEVAGRLKIKLKSARITSTSGLRYYERLRPYAVVKVRDDRGALGIWRSATMIRTVFPRWDEKFKFSIAHGFSHIGVEVQVVHRARSRRQRNHFIGRGELFFEKKVLQNTAGERLEYIVQLENEKLVETGTVELEVTWEPWKVNGAWDLLRIASQSPKVVNVVGAISNIMAGPILLMAGFVPWTNAPPWATGDEGKHISPMGALLNYGIGTPRSVCTSIGSIAAMVNGFLQLMGALGIFGETWDCARPRIFELMDQPERDDPSGTAQEIAGPSYPVDESGLNLHLIAKHVNSRLDLDYRMFLGVGFQITISGQLFVLRLMLWTLHLLALLMAVLAVVITAFVDEVTLDNMDIGFLLTVAATLMFIHASFLFDKSSRLFRDEETRTDLDPTKKVSTRTAGSRRSFRERAKDNWRSTRWASMFGRKPKRHAAEAGLGAGRSQSGLSIGSMGSEASTAPALVV
mmetsp:Transcript_33829/g.79058  ORF Transcript_33829/g.79058 Transcript_33829/m.79058 type:complete len:492 (-) Transcript_33829:52-1527(-)